MFKRESQITTDSVRSITAIELTDRALRLADEAKTHEAFLALYRAMLTCKQG